MDISLIKKIFGKTHKSGGIHLLENPSKLCHDHHGESTQTFFRKKVNDILSKRNVCKKHTHTHKMDENKFK